MMSGYDATPDGEAGSGPREPFGPREAMSTLSASDQTARAELTSPLSRRFVAAAYAVCGALCIAVWLAGPSLGIGEYLGLFATFLMLLLLAHSVGRKARSGVVEKRSVAQPERWWADWLPSPWWFLYFGVRAAAHLTRHLTLSARLGLVVACLIVVAVGFGVYARRYGFSERRVVGALVIVGWYAVVYLSLSATLLIVALFCLLMCAGQLVWAHQDALGASR